MSPITMDDVTSGFNIGTNISMLPQFNDIIGFSEDEVREMITYTKMKRTSGRCYGGRVGGTDEAMV